MTNKEYYEGDLSYALTAFIQWYDDNEDTVESIFESKSGCFPDDRRSMAFSWWLNMEQDDILISSPVQTKMKTKKSVDEAKSEEPPDKKRIEVFLKNNPINELPKVSIETRVLMHDFDHFLNAIGLDSYYDFKSMYELYKFLKGIESLEDFNVLRCTSRTCEKFAVTINNFCEGIIHWSCNSMFEFQFDYFGISNMLSVIISRYDRDIESYRKDYLKYCVNKTDNGKDAEKEEDEGKIVTVVKSAEYKAMQYNGKNYESILKFIDEYDIKYICNGEDRINDMLTSVLTEGHWIVAGLGYNCPILAEKDFNKIFKRIDNGN